MEFRILGPLEVVHEGRPVPLPGSRERAVLVLLLLSANRVVSVDRLVDALWGEHVPEGALQALRVFVSRLRKALRQAGGGEVVVTRAPGYVVEIEPATLDAARFEGLVAQGREQAAHGDPAGAASTLRQGLILWRGAALADIAEAPAVRAEAARLEEARLAALEARIDADLACGRHAELVPELDQLSKAHPLREGLWGQRMIALYRSGRQADALRAYQELRRFLGEELGLEPGLEVARLESAILAHAPELEMPGRSPVPDSGRSEAMAEATTFLFSDIEASTRRWEGAPESMKADLARHDELLRAAVENAGGEVFSHTGDGMGAAFAAASDGVEAAVAAQRALASGPWEAGPLRVRMAIHSGPAQRREGNYFGPPLNRVARLLASGSGGQILCSQSAAELVGADLPADVFLTDLGEHRLADLARPERIFQVTHPDLPADFPSLRTLSAHRHNLPVALTPFVGRAKELAELVSLLGTSRLITLTGVGGAGKTRLALQAAAAVLEAYPDGVWMVELAPLRDGAQLPSAVTTALGIEVGGADTSDAVAGRLAHYLASRQALLVFDNCEHLIEPAARLVHRLVTHCPSITVMATSRELLGLPGERAWRVPPLSLPPAGAPPEEISESDAVGFFCERARAARPGFTLDAATAPTVARICRRLDGIPLALELAAARVQVLSPAQVADRLDDRFRLLTGRERIAVPRHQTLRATIDWSYQLLSPLEQSALDALAVFPETFDLEAAEAVMATDSDQGGDPLDVLSRLVDKSLVTVHTEGPAPRYRLLETIRQYGAEKLAECGQEAATRNRHRDAFIARVEGWRGTQLGADVMAGLVSDIENFRAALDWSWAQGDAESILRLLITLWASCFWWGNPEGHDWLQRIDSDPRFAAPELAEHPGQADVMGFRAFLLHDGEPDRQDDVMSQAFDLARRAGDGLRAARIEWLRGELRLLRGDTATARRLFESVLVSYEQLGIPDGVGWTQEHLGWTSVAEGDFDQAREHFERAVEVARSDPQGLWLEPHALAALAPYVALAGDGCRARVLAEEAIDAARALGAAPVLVMALIRAAETAVVAGQLDDAAPLVTEALGVLSDLGTQRWVADGLDLAALVLEHRGQGAPAAELVGVSATLRQASGEVFAHLPVVAAALVEARARLTGVLGPESFDEHERRGRTLPREAAIARTLSALSEG